MRYVCYSHVNFARDTMAACACHEVDSILFYLILKANHAELLLPAYYLSKKARTRFLDSLHGPHGLAADPAAMCRAILSTTNPRQTLFEHAS